MKKVWGNIVFYFAKFIDLIFRGLIKIVDFIIDAGKYLRRLLIPVLVLLGLGSFMMPFLFIVVFTPMGLTLILLAVLVLIIPAIGSVASSWLSYARYIVTEYLYDYADYYRLGKDKKISFSEYKHRYQQKQEEEFRREQERRQRAQNEQWQRIFEEFFNQSNFGGYQRTNQGGYQGSYQGGYQGSSYNPMQDFTDQYEKACDTLGISYDTDIYEVKLNYRKLAKKYHPDVNKDPGASDKFKEVSSAYEFLSEENIDRYKRIKGL